MRRARSPVHIMPLEGLADSRRFLSEFKPPNVRPDPAPDTPLGFRNVPGGCRPLPSFSNVYLMY